MSINKNYVHFKIDCKFDYSANTQSSRVRIIQHLFYSQYSLKRYEILDQIYFSRFANRLCFGFLSLVIKIFLYIFKFFTYYFAILNICNLCDGFCRLLECVWRDDVSCNWACFLFTGFKTSSTWSHASVRLSDWATVTEFFPVSVHEFDLETVCCDSGFEPWITGILFSNFLHGSNWF